MKTLTSIALAGALAATSVGMTATAADAGGRNHYRPHYHHHSYNPGPAIVAGTVFGLAVGALAAQTFAPPPYYPPAPVLYPAPDPHVQWCAATYRSYDARSDTWVDYQGITRRCIAPY